MKLVDPPLTCTAQRLPRLSAILGCCFGTALKRSDKGTHSLRVLRHPASKSNLNLDGSFILESLNYQSISAARQLASDCGLTSASAYLEATSEEAARAQSSITSQISLFPLFTLLCQNLASSDASIVYIPLDHTSPRQHRSCWPLPLRCACPEGGGGVQNQKRGPRYRRQWK